MSLRTLTMNGEKATFHKAAFRQYFDRQARRESIGREALKEKLAEAVGVSRDTIHKWYGSGGGPIDMEALQRLTEAMGLSDPKLLLRFQKEGFKMNPMTDRERAAAKRIYDACIVFLTEYAETQGYYDLWVQFKNQGSPDPEADVFDHIDRKLQELHLILDQEYFDLHNSDIYLPLGTFVLEDLEEMYIPLCIYKENGPDPRSEKTMNEWQDHALIQLNSIIETYV